MKLIPYLNFNGNCEEALNFYKGILGGNINIAGRYDNPAMNAPEEYKNKILHAVFESGDIKIYASDVFPGSNLTAGKNVALSLETPDLEQAKKVFNSLAEGGKINVPFEKQFWGDWHGNLVDKFGISWMMNAH